MNQNNLFDRYGPWAVIAGGSEGMGSAFAERLAAQGFSLMLIARKPGPLEEVAAKVRKNYDVEVRTLAMDLTAPDAATRIVDAVRDCEVGFLIYNAGAESASAHFMERPIEDAEHITALNILTPLRLIRQLAAPMIERGSGGVLLTGSIGGIAGTPGFAAYSAVKAFLHVFAEGLWHELSTKSVDVQCAILPLVRTPAMERLGLDFDNEQLQGADPFDIVDEALSEMRHGPALHSGGASEFAMQLRAMPRDEAVRSIVTLSDSTNASPRS